MSVHKGIKYQCDGCDSKFASKDHLKRHKMSVHEGIKYQCNLCDSTVVSKGHLLIFEIREIFCS